MTVFGPLGNKPVDVWGPIASMTVSIPGFGGIDGWVLSGLQVGAKEITDIRQCFGDISYIYALGNDQGKCVLVLNFLVFVGMCPGDNNTKALMEGLGAYSNNRISKHPEPLTISVGNFSVQGYLDGISIGQYDPGRAVFGAQVEFIMELQ